jgi:biopolymer transport protein ExbB
MHITDKFLSFTMLGAEWVLLLLIGLSVISVAIIIERLWYFLTHNFNLDETGAQVQKHLAANKIAEAKQVLQGSGNESVEAAVALAGLNAIDKGPDAVSEAMLASKAKERLKLERNLAVLGTLGNNTPFIGLFGTVLGIIKASKDLTASAGGGQAQQAVMAGVFEALIATAVGLMVAIPAVIFYNYFQRRARASLARVDSLAHGVLSVLRAEDKQEAARQPLTEVK